MSDPAGSYQVIELPPGRRAWINALDLSGPTHWMCGLLEVDVTLEPFMNVLKLTLEWVRYGGS